MVTSKHTHLVIAFGTVLILGGCAPGTGLSPNTTLAPIDPSSVRNTGNPGDPAKGQNTEAQQSFNRFPDIPIPSGANMDMTRTIVFGSGEGWYGQLGLDTGHDSNTMFDFYKQELPGFGWNEITSVRAAASILTYERQGRVISIQLEKGTLSGTRVTVIISPRGGQTATPIN